MRSRMLSKAYGKAVARRDLLSKEVGTQVMRRKVDYEGLRSSIIVKYGFDRFVGFWIPRIAYLESTILFHFASEGKKLYWVKRYRMGSRMMVIYKLGCSYVFLETFGRKDICEVRISKDIDRWFRLSLFSGLLSGRESVRRVLIAGVGREWILDVSSMWKEYFDSGSEKDFSRWAQDHQKMARVRVMKRRTVIGRRFSKKL